MVLNENDALSGFSASKPERKLAFKVLSYLELTSLYIISLTLYSYY